MIVTEKPVFFNNTIILVTKYKKKHSVYILRKGEYNVRHRVGYVVQQVEERCVNVKSIVTLAEKEFRKLSKKEQKRINMLKRIPVARPGYQFDKTESPRKKRWEEE